MTVNDLFQVVEDYNDQALKACVGDLFKVLGFLVLKQEEVRPVDLKEKLAEFFMSNRCVTGKNKQFESSYAEIMGEIAESYITPTDQRSANYAIARETMIKRMQGEGGNLASLESLVVILVSEFRGSERQGHGIEPTSISNVHYSLRTGDASTIEHVCYNKYRKLSKNAKLPEMLNKRLQPEEQVFLYVVTTMIFYRVLQMQGDI